MKRIALFGLLPALFAASAMAEPQQYRCTYLESTYDAPFMTEPATRLCPAGQCYYDLTIDGQRGVVNGTAGYEVDSNQENLILRRAYLNPIMNSTDTATFRIDLGTLRFVAEKTTAPGVTVTSYGECVPVEPGAPAARQ